MSKLLLKSENLVFALSLLIVIVLYFPVFLNPNDIVFASAGDGIKNYYTYLFHAKYAHSFWEFQGMNYPFYEHIVYTDAQPLLSYIIHLLGLSDYGIGILNSLLLLSFPISAVLIYKVLKHYRVNTIWAICTGITIALFSPQIFRLTGHLSLSYSFAIPLMWLLLIKITEHKNFKWTFILFLVLGIAFFTHPYLGLIMSVFGLSYALVFLIFDKKQLKTQLLRVVSPILLVILVFQIIIALSDTHVDRMKSPSGFFDYYADWASLLVAHHGPMLFFKTLFNWEQSPWETWSYLGVFSVLLIVFSIGFYLFNIKSIALKKLVNSSIFRVFLAGHLVLIFSFCIPFKYELFKPIVESISPLKQFRVLGRFAWVYFYIFSVAGVVFLQFILNKNKKFKLPIQLFYFLGLFFTILEIYPAHKDVSETITKTRNPFKQEQLNSDLNSLINWTKHQDYDAIIFLPFTYLSSENIFLQGTEKGNFESMMLSFHTQTPLINTITSRTSVTEAIQVQNLFSLDYIEKNLFQSIAKDQKILLVSNTDELNAEEQRMVQAFEPIFNNENYTAYHFSKSEWNSSKAFEEVKANSRSAHFEVGKAWRSDTKEKWFIYDGFEDLAQDITMVGKGALAGQKDKYAIIKENIQFPSTGTYRCSFWYNIRVDRVNQMAVIEQTFTNGKSSWVVINDIRETNLIVGDWARVTMDFEVTDSVVGTKLFLPPNETKDWFVVDELLIQKVDNSNLFKEEVLNDKEYLIYNNDWIDLQSFSN